MKKTYTKKQITEAIAYWKKQLKKMDEDAGQNDNVIVVIAVAKQRGYNVSSIVGARKYYVVPRAFAERLMELDVFASNIVEKSQQIAFAQLPDPKASELTGGSNFTIGKYSQTIRQLFGEIGHECDVFMFASHPKYNTYSYSSKMGQMGIVYGTWYKMDTSEPLADGARPVEAEVIAEAPYFTYRSSVEQIFSKVNSINDVDIADEFHKFIGK